MRRGFSVIEGLVVLAVLAVLLSVLLPTLVAARDISRTTVCLGNLRQIGSAWVAYVTDHEAFPAHERPGAGGDWSYGGVQHAGTVLQSLDRSRPINPYLIEDVGDREVAGLDASMEELFRCPSDAGVVRRGGGDAGAGFSVLQAGTCFEQFGTSYRANPALTDARQAGVSDTRRPLRASEVTASASTLLTLGDPAWYYATRDASSPEADLDASWHGRPDAGNMMASDGSARWFDVVGDTRPFELRPVIGR